ncbi:MAG TPA: non-ribosomal peptide synthetase [Pyrinomonadaceae bacterium]
MQKQMGVETLQQTLSRVARSFAGKPALEWRDRVVTYGEFEAATNRLANRLIASGYGPGSVVAVVVEDRLLLAETVVGLFKAGCAFAPLSLSEPGPRLRKMVETIRPALLVVEGRLADALAGHFDAAEWAGRLMFVGEKEANAPAAEEFGAEAPAPDIAPDGLCYLYFTSGSTGVPKAVAGRQKSLQHFIEWEARALGVTEEFRTSQLMTPTFDAYLRDLFLPLSQGATLCVPDGRGVVIDPEQLVAWVERKGVNLIHCVPSVFRAVVKQGLDARRLAQLKYVVMAGERLYPAEVKTWMETYGERIRLVNLYGATENTMAKFCHVVEWADAARPSVPIGRPIDGAKGIILDSEMKVCEPGTVGEIYIRTPYLSHGYYEDPQHTAEVFVRNPFGQDPADIIHKTGDYGRLLPDGNFELVGRRDHQVKIRGQRVELGEIESVVRSLPGVHECVAAVWGAEPDDQRLAAYVVAAEGHALDVRALQQAARESLPDVMVPSSFNVLDALPLNANGKVDRKALPAPGSDEAPRVEDYVAPSGDTEGKLAAIWAGVLRLERVGARDNFFWLGGHSLLATQVISRVRDEFGVALPLRTIFERPSVAMMAEAIEETGAAQSEADELDVLALVEQMPEEELNALLERLA